MKKIIRLTETDLTNLVKRIINSVELIYEDRNWVEPSIKEQIENFVNKYKGNEDRIFVSYRSGEYVSFINPKNTFNTPTGIYTYPWKGYFDEIFNKAKNKPKIDYRTLIPFAGGETSKFIYLYKIKDDAFIINNNTTYDEILPYAKRLKNFFTNSILLESYLKSEKDYLKTSKNKFLKGHPCDKCLGKKQNVKCYNCDGSGYEIKYDYTSSALIFWVLIFDLIDQTETKGQKQTKFTNICNQIGVDGFLDLGGGYIHPNEPYQAVLLKGKSIVEDYVSISLDTDTKTIHLVNTIINAKPLQLQGIIRNNQNDFSKIAKYMKNENLLDDFINKTITSIDEMPDKQIIYSNYPMKGKNNKEKKINFKKEIIDFFKRLISYLPKEEIKFKTKDFDLIEETKKWV